MGNTERIGKNNLKTFGMSIKILLRQAATGIKIVKKGIDLQTEKSRFDKN